MKSWTFRISPKRLSPELGSAFIHVLEMAAVLLACHVWMRDGVPGPVLFFIDNNTALGSIIKGRSNAAILRSQVHELWLMLAGARAEAWFERVPSAENISDLPSRMDITWMPFSPRTVRDRASPSEPSCRPVALGVCVVRLPSLFFFFVDRSAATPRRFLGFLLRVGLPPARGGPAV